MNEWVKWLVVAIAVVLILGLISYARGDRQRGEDVPVESSGSVLVLASA